MRHKSVKPLTAVSLGAISRRVSLQTCGLSSCSASICGSDWGESIWFYMLIPHFYPCLDFTQKSNGRLFQRVFRLEVENSTATWFYKVQNMQKHEFPTTEHRGLPPSSPGLAFVTRNLGPVCTVGATLRATARMSSTARSVDPRMRIKINRTT